MGYTNSPMVVYTKLSPNHSGQRTMAIDRITPHCVVGQCTAEGLGDWFYKSSTQASSNYGIDKDGRVGMYVEEKNRSWCSSSGANDQRAIELCIDICKRNGKNKLIWFGDKDKTLNYSPKSGEMILTVHRWFANKSCPGNWMYARMGDLADKVTKALQGSSDSGSGGGSDSGDTGKVKWYRVRKTWTDGKSQKGAYKILANAKKCADQNPGYKVFDADGKVVYEPKAAEPEVKVPFLVEVKIKDLNIRKGPGTDYGRVQFCPPGIYTIVAVSDGAGTSSWGKMKSGIGWIALEYTVRL